MHDAKHLWKDTSRLYQYTGLPVALFKCMWIQPGILATDNMGNHSLYCNIVALLCQYLNNLYKILRILNKQNNITQLNVARKPRKILGG